MSVRFNFLFLSIILCQIDILKEIMIYHNKRFEPAWIQANFCSYFVALYSFTKIMNNKLNTVLFKSIVNSEFLILSGKSRPARQKSSRIVMNRSENRLELGLDLFELVKSVKQFVRVLQFLKKNCKGELVICSSNIDTLELLNLYRGEFTGFERVRTEVDCKRSFGPALKRRSLLLLEDSLSDRATLSKLFEEKVLLINKLNPLLEAQNHCTYKIFNDVTNFKKLAFLACLIESVLSRK